MAERSAKGTKWRRRAFCLGGLAVLGAVLLFAFRTDLACRYWRWRIARESAPEKWVAAARALADGPHGAACAERLEGTARLRWLLAVGEGRRGASPAQPQGADDLQEEAAIAARFADGVSRGLQPDREPVRLTREHPETARQALRLAREPAVVRRAASWLAAARDRDAFVPLLAAIEDQSDSAALTTLYGAALQLARTDRRRRLALVERAYPQPALRARALGLALEVGGDEVVLLLARLARSVQLDPGARFHLSEAVRKLTGTPLGDDPEAWERWVREQRRARAEQKR